jgi:hypothetical protein
LFLKRLHRARDVGFGALEALAPDRELVARETVLKRGFRGFLQGRMNRRAQGIGRGRQTLDPGHRLGVAAQVIDEMEAAGAARPFVGHELGEGFEPLLHLRSVITPSSRMRVST